MRRWLLYHIPKTGGTSISQHLREELEASRTFMSVTLQDRPDSLRPDEVRRAPLHELERIRVFQGHGVGRFIADLLPDDAFSEMVVLREPAARIISHYNFRASPASLQPIGDLTFESFLLTFPPDFMLRFLCSRLGYPVNSRSLDRIIHDLAGMYALTTVDMDAAIVAVSRSLGVSTKARRRNVTGIDFPARLVPDPELIQRLRQLNPLDAILFEAVRDMAPRSIARLRALDKEAP
jgi:hypothetical protein